MLTLVGHDRRFTPPAPVRAAAADTCRTMQHDDLDWAVAAGRVEAWDLLALADRPTTSQWASAALQGILAAASTPVDCAGGDCADTGFYGVPDDHNPDILVGLWRRAGGTHQHEQLTAGGQWVPVAADRHVEILDLDIAQDLSNALLAGAGGLVRRFCWPVAFLRPGAQVAAGPPTSGGFVPFAVVDDIDNDAVLDLVQIAPGPKVQRWDKGEWVDDPDMTARLTGIDPPPLVELDEATAQDVIRQATQAGKPATAAAVRADGNAETLRRYWTSGKGALKIRWGTPGDWRRCFRYLSKYLGERAKGYCQLRHHDATGVYTGSRLNASGAMSVEAALVASLQSGQWAGDHEGTEPMTTTTLADGIYSEATTENDALLRTLTAGAFPVAPPEEWFKDPVLAGATPLTVTDEGRVFGHIATFDTAHIGLPGRVPPPRSASGYAYFMTGELITASGAKVNVGTLTLSGGHAPLSADARAAVEHYDNTASGAVDVCAGEDRYGIWVAGAVRPDITPEQLRTLRASAPSGDWRPINGRLELVACCQVNVPGFPVTRARVASGAVMALVAAGARPLAERKAALAVDAALTERVDYLQEQVTALLAASGLVIETPAGDAPEASTAEEIAHEQVVAAQVLTDAVGAGSLDAPAVVQQAGDAPETLTPEQIAEYRELLAARDAATAAVTEPEPVVDETPAEPAEPAEPVAPVVDETPAEQAAPEVTDEQRARVTAVRDRLRAERRQALRDRVAARPVAAAATQK